MAEAEGDYIECVDLNYKVNGKMILDGVCGRFRPGYLSAIMGPSGAGKTSLLNILSGYMVPKHLEGSITLAGEARNLCWLRQQSCYITQQCTLLEYLTVRETLHIAASLKLSSRVSDKKKHDVVEEIATTLGLFGVLDSRVNFLSGGEKKRVSIGVELVTDPPMMFCDEPTSGLDSYSSFQVMTHLQSLARGGRTIIVVIHSPSSRLLELIDDVLLLSEGRCIYNGSLQDLLPTFSSIGLQCPQYYNRADFAMEVACKERGNFIEELVKLAGQNHRCRSGSFYENTTPSLADYDKSYFTEHACMLTCGKEVILKVPPQDLTRQVRKQAYPVSHLTQMCVLFRRSVVCNIRDLRLGFLQVTAHILVALLLGLIYYDFGNDAAKVSSNFSCIFFIIIFNFYGTVMHTVLTFPMEASVIVREHFNNWYSLGMYHLAKVFSDLPLLLVCPVVFVAIMYYMTGQPMEWDRFLMLLLVSVVLTILAQTLGCTFGVVFHPQLAIFLLSSCTMPMFLVSGFFIRLNDLSPYIKWLSYISIFRYSLEAAILSVFGFDRPPLKCSEAYCHFRRPKKFLEEVGLENGNYWGNVTVLFCCVIAFHIALFFTLQWKINKATHR